MRYRFALGLALLLAGCSSGGSDDFASIPVLPWGSFRHDANNSSLGSGILDNAGEAILLVNAADLGGVTTSTPAIDNDDNLYIGTATGVVSFGPDGGLRWRVNECAPTSGGAVVPIGRVTSSLTITPGDTIVFGSDPEDGSAGAVFAFSQNNADEVECMWAVRPPNASQRFTVRSSPVAMVDALDLSLVTVIVGGSDGRLLAINGDGTFRWTFPAGVAAGDFSSSPVLSLGGIAYGTTPGGVLAAIDFSGRPMWQATIGRPPQATLQPSPSVATTAYAIGGSSTLFGINPDGTLKWQYLPPTPFSGSLGFLSLSFDQDDENMFDTIVYTVSVDGQIAGILDSNGMPFQPQRCFPGQPDQAPQSCRLDSCMLDGLDTCDSDTQRCTISNIPCTEDSCPDGDSCQVVTGPIYLSGAVRDPGSPVPVSTSLAISADQFVVAGTDDGRLCARALDTNVPGDPDDPTNPWLDGCVTLGSGDEMPTRSSPVIGRQGQIYVTTDEGLFAIQ